MSDIAAARRAIRLYRRAIDVVLLSLICLALVVAARGVLAAPAELGPLENGGLGLTRTDRPDAYIPAPSLALASHTRVTGPVARTTVEQRFRNGEDVWVEALYTFPLPDGAAVDGLTLRIGERLIEGMLKEREQADAGYAAARAEGRRAGLLAQARPNLFTVAIANIAPGEEIAVRLTFQQVLDRDAEGGYRLSLPQTPTHRYTGPDPRLADLGAIPLSPPAEPVLGAGFDPTDPPRHDSALDPGHLVGIAVDLTTGQSLAEIGSPSHELTVLDQGGARYLVTLKDGTIQADRDFVLRWREDPPEAPEGRLFLEEGPDGVHGLLEILPPEARDLPETQPRDFVFVVDGSGSMFGPGIEQARRGLVRALALLRPQDAFTIIRFDDEFQMLFGDFRSADARHLAIARRFVDDLEANGGTEMRPALRAALDLPEREGRLKQIVFLTDGGVSDEAGMFDLVERRLGDARLFPVAVGSAPNGWFMRQAAAFGRGVVTHVDATREADDAIDRLMARLAHPAVTDIELHVEGAEAWHFPDRLPDLLAGAPVSIPVEFDRVPGRVIVTGILGGRPWSAELRPLAVEPGAGLAKLHARAMIQHLVDQGRREGDEALFREAIVEASLAHGVASPFTRFLAVEREISRPSEAGLDQRRLANAAPAGSAPGIMGPQTATPMPLLLLIGVLALAMSAWAGRRVWRG